MAKIGIFKAILLTAAILCGATLATPPALAQTDQQLLDQAIQAEGARNWAAAENFYRQLLQRNPNRADLWERLGDVYGVQNRGVDAANAFARAADIAGGNVRIQLKTAQAYSAVEQPDNALPYLARAAAIDPGNADTWYNKSVTESWLGRYAEAEESLRRAFAAGLPRNGANLSRLATLQQWQGNNEAAEQTILEMQRVAPNDPESILGAARLYGWGGAYHRALNLLEDYKAAGGDELVYAQEKAILLAWADQPDASLKVSDTALQAHPGDRNLQISQVIAFNRARDYDTAFDILENLEAEAPPGDPELAELRRRFEAPLRSNLSVGAGFSTDRDNIDIVGGEVVYSQALDRGSFFRFGYSGLRAKADPFSGLDRIDNNDAILKNTVWGEFETLLSPDVLAAVKVGGSFTNFGPDAVKIGARLSMRASDQLWVNVGYDRDLFVISPRALSLGIIRNEEYLEFVWVPDPRYYVQARFSLAQHNDTNRQKRGDLTIIRKVSRSPNLKVDAGFNAVWYGYRFQFNNGYYAPNFYQRYLFPLYFTVKISDDDNVVLTLAPGIQKDDTFSNFQFAGVGTIETTHGLFRDWMLKTKWSVYVGGSESALNLLAPATDYWVLSGSFVLVRRF